MKRIVTICLLALMCCLLFSCNSSGKDEGHFWGVVSGRNFNFDDPSFAITGFELDQEVALQIGDAVLTKYFGKSIMINTYFIVYEVEGKGYFVVCRGDKNTFGGAGYNVAINKADGKILGIWYG